MISARVPPSPFVVVLGAGGLGGYLGAVLHRGGARVHLVIRGEHLNAVRRDGLTVVDERGEETCPTPASDELPPVARGDIVFVTVKAHGLADVLPALRRAGEAGAWIVPLVNGVDAAGRLANGGVPPERIIVGVAYLTAFRTAPGRVERQGPHGRLLVGRPSHVGSGRPAHVLEALRPVPWILSGAAIEMEETGEIEVESWRKMMVVTALTGACAMGRATIGQALAESSGLPRARGLVAEAGAVARASGVGVSEALESAAFERVCAFPHDFRPSLIHDLARGVPTEVDALHGAIARIGRTVGVPTPLHDRAAQVIREAERATGSPLRPT
ncbi:MAG: 2-dehydropantoate 2-reductase [Gemmatimonadetes bacterium]|nr:2-dehydropantoate 2-reductase [Gemmatimonadota bacterium]